MEHKNKVEQKSAERKKVAKDQEREKDEIQTSSIKENEKREAEEDLSDNTGLFVTIKRLEEEISSLKDLYLRKQAEFENFRKRVSKEKEDIVAYTRKQIMEDLIALLDNFDRALNANTENKDFNQLYSGVSMTRESFISSMMNKYQLEAFGQVGDIFNPEHHEAISVENGSETSQPIIKEIFQKGYFLKGRVIRTAKVKVIQA